MTGRKGTFLKKSFSKQKKLKQCVTSSPTHKDWLKEFFQTEKKYTYTQQIIFSISSFINILDDSNKNYNTTWYTNCISKLGMQMVKEKWSFDTLVKVKMLIPADYWKSHIQIAIIATTTTKTIPRQTQKHYK